jgi:hypothetical protein
VFANFLGLVSLGLPLGLAVLGLAGFVLASMEAALDGLVVVSVLEAGAEAVGEVEVLALFVQLVVAETGCNKNDFEIIFSV